MRRSSRPSRTIAKLSESTQQRLNSYALAAAAAGVGVWACVVPAEAKIIYTHTHVVLKPYQHYNLDLNHDKVPDFVLENSITGTDPPVFGLWVGKPMPGDSVIGYRTNGDLNFASALKKGSRIGFGRRFDTFTEAMVFKASSRLLGKWSNVKNRYLGLRFKIRGRAHYGWARLTVKVQGNSITAILTGYAYETIPGKGIIAGQTKGPDDISVEEPDAALTMPTPKPATLGALAMGAPGLSIWRREERRSHLDT
jgi:hypothetical protein